jgi:hypothetical protein
VGMTAISERGTVPAGGSRRRAARCASAYLKVQGA